MYLNAVDKVTGSKADNFIKNYKFSTRTSSTPNSTQTEDIVNISGSNLT